MYSKIAVGNVRKSFKDYSIYFLTLTLAVCIFYSFNSIESQKAILELSKSESRSLDMLMQIISMVSVFVSFILGGLIVYASNFLIKKRKKELGIYMTLGMSKGKISRILLVETVLVGIVSLASGLILGILASQGLSIFTSKLFEVSMLEYKFIVSANAIGKTILYFGVMFVLVMIFNTFIISKYKIIDLLTASRKNESIKNRNSIIYVAIFILSIVTLCISYKFINEVGLNIQEIKFKLSIATGIIGTMLFFFSLAGFGLNVIQKSKNIYFKDLNIFILRQINSKINTNYISMSIICIMLLLTIGTLSTGLSFKDALEKGLEANTPFDATGIMYVYEEDKVKSIEESLNNLNFKFDNNEKYMFYKEYRLEDTMKSSLNKYVHKEDSDKIAKNDKFKTYLIKISDFNQIRELQGKEAMSLKENEVILSSNNMQIVDVLNSILKYNDKISINNEEYNISNKKVVTDALRSSAYSDNIYTLVVNDTFIEKTNAKLSTSYLNINFDDKDRMKSEEKFTKLFQGFYDNKYNIDETGFIVGYTKDQIYAENKGLTTTVIFVGIYLGIVFLISSMAVLSLQQLSEASDSIDRYKSLKRIGANEKMINKTIFIQTLIYFTLPLGLAFIHSLVGIHVVNEFIQMFGKPDIGNSSIITALIFGVVYMGYFYATYTGYKNIVKNS